MPGWWTTKYGEGSGQRKERLQKLDKWLAPDGFVPTRARLAKKNKLSLTKSEQLPDMAQFAPTESEVTAYKNVLAGTYCGGNTDESCRTPSDALMDAADWDGKDASPRECVEWVARHLDIKDAPTFCDPPDPLAVTMWRLATVNEATRQNFLDGWVQKLMPTGAAIKKEDRDDLIRDVATDTVDRLLRLRQRVPVKMGASGPQGPGHEPFLA